MSTFRFIITNLIEFLWLKYEIINLFEIPSNWRDYEWQHECHSQAGGKWLTFYTLLQWLLLSPEQNIFSSRPLFRETDMSGPRNKGIIYIIPLFRGKAAYFAALAALPRYPAGLPAVGQEITAK